MSGVREAAGSVDTLGLIARSVEDIALYRAVLLGIAPQPIPAPPSRLRIGFCRTQIWHTVDPVYQGRLEAAAQRLARAGAAVTEVALPFEFARVADAHLAISSFEFSRNFTHEIERHWEKISETLRNGRLKDGLACSYERYAGAQTFAAACRRMLDEVFGDYDVLMAPSTDGEAPVGLNATGNASFCTLWTTLHVPAVTLPVFTGSNNLPLGLQLIARHGEDQRLFSAAAWVRHALT